MIAQDDPTLNKNIAEALNAEDMLAESVFDGPFAERMLKKYTANQQKSNFTYSV